MQGDGARILSSSWIFDSDFCPGKLDRSRNFKNRFIEFNYKSVLDIFLLISNFLWCIVCHFFEGY